MQSPQLLYTLSWIFLVFLIILPIRIDKTDTYLTWLVVFLWIYIAQLFILGSYLCYCTWSYVFPMSRFVQRDSFPRSVLKLVSMALGIPTWVMHLLFIISWVFSVAFTVWLHFYLRGNIGFDGAPVLLMISIGAASSVVLLCIFAVMKYVEKEAWNALQLTLMGLFVASCFLSILLWAAGVNPWYHSFVPLLIANGAYVLSPCLLAVFVRVFNYVHTEDEEYTKPKSYATLIAVGVLYWISVYLIYLKMFGAHNLTYLGSFAPMIAGHAVFCIFRWRDALVYSAKILNGLS
eukprot:TRINITY_DN4851_c0_g1_i1.p1 TRINITY_DN4851_c0_g1~~TRINITY_DN4851_c0_g1_i1.p1  ORF type:complete len:330 (-),score=71.84 TRINITY_DN4851_c0_g1_i1:70-942(-)